MIRSGYYLLVVCYFPIRSRGGLISQQARGRAGRAPQMGASLLSLHAVSYLLSRWGVRRAGGRGVPGEGLEVVCSADYMSWPLSELPLCIAATTARTPPDLGPCIFP